MDISLFSKCVKELIVENERVDVPYLGSFTAELQPATYSDHQTTIHPPYRKMSFHKEDVSLEQGRLLLEKVMRESGVTQEQAGVELGWCLSRLSSELEGHKSCKLPGLGVMRANARNEFFFVPDDKLDIWPDGIGFEPIFIKVSEEESSEAAGGDRSREHFSRAGRSPEQRSEIPGQARNDGKRSEIPGQARNDGKRSEIPETAVAPAKQPVWDQFQEEVSGVASTIWKLRTGRLILIILAVLIVLFIVAAYVFTDEMSPILDRLLYTKEELELLRRR
ncbi:MAG: hypothetical protein IJQ69_00975 [Bacteroidales bacterium]|nr:hypothetical protein [Bacteroidales bacterium]